MYYFIVNPYSKSGRGSMIWKRLEKQLDGMGIEYKAYVTEKPGEAREMAANLTKGCKEPKVVIAVGGDGTINEVLNGLAFCGPVIFGCIPAGSGNDMARSLNLPKSPIRCLHKILNPQYHQRLDYGVLSYGKEEIAHRRFMVSSGIGFDAAVCHNLLYSKVKIILNKLHLGKLSYMMIGLKQLALARPSKGYLVLDGVQKVEFNHIYFVSAHIHSYEGGGFNFAPQADPSDGKLDICVVYQSSKRMLLPALLKAWVGRNRSCRGIRHFVCREAEIHTDNVLPVHVDGESCFYQRDLQLRCISKQIKMIV